MKGRRREIFECPNCGADVPVGARACRECGSDATTGWQSEEEIDYQSLELPEGYAQGEGHEGGSVASARPRWVLITALVVVVAFAAWLVLR